MNCRTFVQNLFLSVAASAGIRLATADIKPESTGVRHLVVNNDVSEHRFESKPVAWSGKGMENGAAPLWRNQKK